MTKPEPPKYLNSDGSDAGPGWVNYKSPEKIAQEAGTPETPSESISVHDGTMLTPGETPSALSAADWWGEDDDWCGKYGDLWDEAEKIRIERDDLRSKLSTAEQERDYLRREIEVLWKPTRYAAEAELARVRNSVREEIRREMMARFSSQLSMEEIASCAYAVEAALRTGAVQERERKGE